MEEKQNNFVIAESEYSIGKDTDGVEHTTKDLHAVLLDAILEVDRICRKNNIPYALAYGSALGAYNYGDFIPWDDDVDIAINYEDIPRFVEACNKDLDSKYLFECYENNKKYNVLIPTGKLRIKDTYLKERNWFWLPNRCGSGQTAFIDIVAFMGVPEDKKKHHRIIKSFIKYIVLYIGVDALLRIHPRLMKRRIKNRERKFAEKYKDSPCVGQTMIIPFQIVGKTEDCYSYPREVIYPFKEYDFCGHKIFSFNNLEEFCRIRYGEHSLKHFENGKWVDPYPLDQRKLKHIAKYNLNNKK